MSSTQVRSETAIETPRARRVDMKLEVVVIPVSDVDRAKRFYGGLGWRLDADFAVGDEFRVVQFTPPGSPCSIHLRHGRHVGRAGLGPGPVSHRLRHRGRARRARRRGVEVSEVFHDVGGVSTTPDRPAVSAARDPQRTQLRARSPRSAIRTATAGCSRRSPRDCPDAWMRTTRRSPRRPSSRARSAARRPRTASTRSGPASKMRTGRTGTPSTWCGSRPARRCRHEQRLRRHRHRRRLAGRALRRRARRGRPARRTRRARAGRRRVLLLGVHPVEDAAAPGRGRARRERRGGDGAGRRRGGARLA